MRAIGRVTRARALTVRSPVSKVPLRTIAAAGMPRIVPRSAWQADESIVRAKPEYADTLRMAYVHHTAGTNSYTRLQAPAVVRAIEVYHVKGNGWNDIGYNALVDRFGTVYEGRCGGIDRNVVGAHAKGFNTGSFGIAVMGDFRTVDPPAAAVDALVRTLAVAARPRPRRPALDVQRHLRPATSASSRGSPSSCAPSRATATRGSRPARASVCTT